MSSCPWQIGKTNIAVDSKKKILLHMVLFQQERDQKKPMKHHSKSNPESVQPSLVQYNHYKNWIEILYHSVKFLQYVPILQVITPFYVPIPKTNSNISNQQLKNAKI